MDSNTTNNIAQPQKRLRLNLRHSQPQDSQSAEATVGNAHIAEETKHRLEENHSGDDEKVLNQRRDYYDLATLTSDDNLDFSETLGYTQGFSSTKCPIKRAEWVLAKALPEWNEQKDQ